MRKERSETGVPLEQHYKESFKDFQVTPSKGLLDKIQQSLPATQAPVSYWVKYSIYLKLLLSVSIVFNTLFVFLYFRQGTDTSYAIGNRNTIPARQPLLKDQTGHEDNNLSGPETTDRKTSVPGRTEHKVSGVTRESGNATRFDTAVKTQEPTLPKDVARESPQVMESKKGKESLPQAEQDLEGNATEVDFYQKHSAKYKDSLRNLFKK